MKYDLEIIETAFFNYKANGAEQTELEYETKKREWQMFKSHLKIEQTAKERVDIFNFNKEGRK